MFVLSSGEFDWFGFINIGGAFLLLVIGFSMVFYSVYRNEKKFEEEMRQLDIELRERREEWNRKKQESLEERLKQQEERNRWKTRK